MEEKNYWFSEIIINNSNFEFKTKITNEIDIAKQELLDNDDKLEENLNKIKRLTVDLDKTDYILAGSIGVITGVLDSIFVNKPKDSILDKKMNYYYEQVVINFAKLNGWKYKQKNLDRKSILHSAIKFLENKFKVPYDQSVTVKNVIDLTPSNHHFKSLGHSFSIMGLIFSIIDQYNGTSHFADSIDGEIILKVDDWETFNDFRKGFTNWLGHLFSDFAGSKSSKGRGMGIPTAFNTWINGIVDIKSKLKIPNNKFEQMICELSNEIFEKGYDMRFQITQSITVLLNDFLVRLIYSIRRLLKYISENNGNYNVKESIKYCSPFFNASVVRMSTVSHAAFLSVDLIDASIKGIRKRNITEFFLNINVIGVCAFTISLKNEIKYHKKRIKAVEKKMYLESKHRIIQNYIDNLEIIANNDKNNEIILDMINEFYSNKMYKKAFEKSIEYSNNNGVLDEYILKNKKDIDNYIHNEDSAHERIKDESSKKNNKAEEEYKTSGNEIINNLNNQIQKLGELDNKLYNKLIIFQNEIDKIRDIPTGLNLDFKKTEKVSENWKNNTEQLNVEFKKGMKKSGIELGAGVGLGAGVATLAPTAAMGIATTFGTASTGVAISSLSGAAASNAALAWLGGGALAAGGGGMATGSTILALAGPVGWGLAGTIFVAVGTKMLLSRKERKLYNNLCELMVKRENNRHKEAIFEVESRINQIKKGIIIINSSTNRIKELGYDYDKMTKNQQYELGTFVNIKEFSVRLLTEPIKSILPYFGDNDLNNFIASLTNTNDKNYCINNRVLIMYIANELNNIEIDEKIKKIYYKSIIKNKDLLISLELEKKSIKIKVVDIALKALEFKYQQEKELENCRV